MAFSAEVHDLVTKYAGLETRRYTRQNIAEKAASQRVFHFEANAESLSCMDGCGGGACGFWGGR